MRSQDAGEVPAGVHSEGRARRGGRRQEEQEKVLRALVVACCYYTWLAVLELTRGGDGEIAKRFQRDSRSLGLMHRTSNNYVCSILGLSFVHTSTIRLPRLIPTFSIS